MKFFGIVFLLFAAACPATAAMKPVALTCENLTNPLGIDAPRPRLSWKLDAPNNARGVKQSAYQILVASDEKTLRANRGDLWDSGKVASDQTALIPYGGEPLASGQRCVWKARAWDGEGKASAYSPAASWEMGLLRPEDWRGQWIGRAEEKAYRPAPLLRREFALKGKVKSARAYVCGLGYYELRLNGRKVGDHHLDPGYTRYDRRALYTVYDVTKQLQEGANALGAMLGTGWYNVHTQAVWYFDKAPWRAAPKLLLELRVTYADGSAETIASDTDWKTSTGAIVYDSIYGGETYDARLEKSGWDAPGYDDSGWQAAQVVAAPGGILSAQAMPPIRKKQTIRPVSVTEPKPGVFLFDMGQNFAGHARLTVSGPAGTEVTLKYGERLHPDGTLDQTHLAQHLLKTDPPQRFQTDSYLLKGRGKETWEARFAYHGFQYVEVTGFPGRPSKSSLEGVFVHSDVPPVAHFACSDELLDTIWRHTRWSYLSNLQSIPTDCPHREKNGWTGDAHLAAEFGLLAFGSAPVYTKWINDLGDEQRTSGELPGIVPSSGWGYEWGNGPAWDSAFLLIPWYQYIYGGDTRSLETHFDGMKRYVDYLTTKAQNGIVSIGLGDWVPFETETPVPVTSTGYYYRDALIVAKAAALLGKPEDARKYAELADGIKKAFNAAFYDPKTGSYANGSQTALSCALYQGLVEPENVAKVVENLVAAVAKRDYHIDTGILGAKYILHALLDHGHADIAYRIVTQKTQPGWGWWIAQGATTLWESWPGVDSRNHIMFGDVSAWFIKALAGIRPDENAPGFARFTIRPHPVGDLTRATASIDTARGVITSGWTIEDDAFTLHVVIPENAAATVYVPANEEPRVTEGAGPHCRFLRVENGYAAYEVGSGGYTFVSKSFSQRQ